jgi:glycosyltransferase involved in cell wall biosynthesis
MNIQRLRAAKGRLTKSPAFLYEDNKDFLCRYSISEWPEYALWLSRNRFFTRQGLIQLHNESKGCRKKPLISILMPVYNPDPSELKQAVDSLLWQAYPHWELCLVDDKSKNRDYLKVLGRLRDRRIKVHLNPIHVGIAGTSQHALEKASGDYIALMDQDDELCPDALFSFVIALQKQDIDYFYSDRDMISSAGDRFMHFMKPGWSPEYLLSFNYACHFEIYRKSLVANVGGFRKGYEGSQDYDLVLRATEKCGNIVHHPMVLYNWRQSRNSVATNLEAKSYAFESGVKAVCDTAKRRCLPVIAAVENKELWRGHYRLIWDDAILTNCKITFLAIGQNEEDSRRIIALLKQCAGAFKDCEFLSMNACCEDIQKVVKTIRHNGPVFFCDSSVTEIVAPALIDMVGYLAIQGVRVVGCKFLDGDNKIFNSGLSISASGKALFAYRGNPADDCGYGAVASVPRNVSSLFPAFWGTKVEDLRQKGFADHKGSYFYAAMRYYKETVKKAGERIVCVPYMCLKVNTAMLDYHEDMKMFLREWQEEGLNDPYYNPNLTDSFEDFGLQTNF